MMIQHPTPANAMIALRDVRTTAAATPGVAGARRLPVSQIIPPTACRIYDRGRELRSKQPRKDGE